MTPAASPRATLGTSLEGKSLGRYRLFRRLAAGGMGSVFLGWQPSAAGVVRAVAVKVIRDGDLSARLVPLVVREARIASSIRHPNVVALTDVVESDHGPVLILEYIAGESLARVLEASTEPVSPPVLSRIMVDALEGLHAAHEATNDRGLPLGVVHRDVSPQNILIDEVGYSKIADFGVAKALDHLSTTESSQIRGKIAYMAPEQLNGKPVDPRADVWAMGVVMWQLLAGRAPFAGLDRAVVMKRVLLGEVDPPTVDSPSQRELVAVCMKALSLSPDDRYASARQMALAVERAHPPAMHRDVARWLRDTVGATLDARAALVAEMLSEGRREEAGPKPAAVEVVPERAPATLRLPPGAPKASANPRTPARSPRAWAWYLGAAVSVVALATGGTLARRAWVNAHHETSPPVVVPEAPKGPATSNAPELVSLTPIPASPAASSHQRIVPRTPVPSPTAVDRDILGPRVLPPASSSASAAPADTLRRDDRH